MKKETKETNIFQERQLKGQAVKLYKAYIYCANRELILTYICIFCGLVFYLFGLILNIIKFYNTDKLSSDIISGFQNGVSLASGIYLILQIF